MGVLQVTAGISGRIISNTDIAKASANLGDDIGSGLKGTGETKLLTNTMDVADHHIIPKFRGKSKKYTEFIAKRGIDVDEFTVTVAHGKASHHLKFIHGQGKWNKKWIEWLNNNPDATVKDIYQFAGKMMDEFGLSGLDIHPYRK